MILILSFSNVEVVDFLRAERVKNSHALPCWRKSFFHLQHSQSESDLPDSFLIISIISLEQHRSFGFNSSH